MNYKSGQTLSQIVAQISAPYRSHYNEAFRSIPTGKSLCVTHPKSGFYVITHSGKTTADKDFTIHKFPPILKHTDTWCGIATESDLFIANAQTGQSWIFKVDDAFDTFLCCNGIHQ